MPIELQLSIVYTEGQAEALCLRSNEATVKVTKRLRVLPGSPEKLSLSGQGTAGRTIANDGSAAQRTILPSTTLRITDK